MAEGRRNYIIAEISADMVDAVTEIAGNEFKTPMQIASEALEYYVGHYAEITKSPEYKFWSVVNQSRGKRSRFEQLKQLGYAWQSSQDQYDMELLEKACEIEGIEVEIVLGALADVGDILGRDIVIRNPKGKAAARLWLIELLSEHRRLPVKQIEALAVEHGFNWNTVKSAKGDVTDNIISTRQPTEWTWDWIPSDEEIMNDIESSGAESSGMPEYELDLGEYEDEEYE